MASRGTSRRLSVIAPGERGADETARFLAKWPTRCLDHEEVITSFCGNHDQLVCSVCLLSNHNQCGSIMGLLETAKGIRSSRECTMLDGTLKKLKTKYEKTHQQQSDVLNSLYQQDKNFVKEVREFREEINAILDKLENAVLARKDNVVTERRNTIKSHRGLCKNAMNMLDNYKKELDRAFLGTDEQLLFLVIKKTHKVLAKYDEQLSDIRAAPSLFTLEFAPNKAIDKFFLTLKDFGSLKLDQASKEIEERKGKSVSKSARERRLSLGSDRISLKSEIAIKSERRHSILPEIPVETSIQKGYNTPKKTRRPATFGEVAVQMDGENEMPFITGVTFMPDDRLVVTDDANKNVKLFTATYKPSDVVKLSNPPRDIAVTKPSQVVVTIPKEKSLQFIDVLKPMQLQKKLTLDIECFGIACHANELYVTSGFAAEREIQLLSLNGDVRKRIRPGIADLRYPLYLTIDPTYKTLFVTDYNHGVIGLDLNTAMVKFKCKDTDVHRYYKGITIGNKGNVYVCTWDLNGVSRVHVDGRGLETIIPMPDKEGRKPHSIAYSKKSAVLAVSLCGGNRGTVSLFRFI